MTLSDPRSVSDIKAKFFRGLADSSRLMVLEALREGPRCVSEIVGATGLSQPSASGHLACLWDCGLVNREHRGRFVYYTIADSRVEALLSASDDLLVRVGQNVFLCTRYQDVDSSSLPAIVSSLGV